MRRYKSISVTAKRDESYFSKKIFFVMSLFYFAALVNLRDFPVNNLPLIYPAFLLCIFTIGLRTMIRGFKNTLFLNGLITIYFIYFHILSFIYGGEFSYRNLAYLLEPLMVITTAGAVTTTHEGTKTALLALVSVIIFSTFCGIWIYFIGEPVASWRLAIQSSVGGSLLAGETLGAAGEIEAALNAGLSYYAFSFSYQLAIAATIIISALVFSSNILILNKKILLLFLSVLILGIITNAERATLLSVSMGLIIILILIRKKELLTLKNTAFFIAVVLIILVTMSYTQNSQVATLHQRETSTEELYLRMIRISVGAFGTIFTQPLGAAGLSDRFIEIAYEFGWTNENGVIAPHNHFAGVIMYTGIVGIFLISSLVIGLWRRMMFLNLRNNSIEIILVSSCIASISHSLTHNAGFFKGELPTNIVFGLLWGYSALLKEQRRQDAYYTNKKLREF